MSGDRYDECPRCKMLATKWDDHMKGYLKTFYGKVEPEAYEELRAKVNQITNPFANYHSAVRLDYGAGVADDGSMEVYAYANCENDCGFEAGHQATVETVLQPPGDALGDAIEQSKGVAELRRMMKSLPFPS